MDPCFHQITDLSYILKPLPESHVKSSLQVEYSKRERTPETEREVSAVAMELVTTLGLEALNASLHASPRRHSLEFQQQSSFQTEDSGQKQEETAWQVACGRGGQAGRAGVPSFILSLSIGQSLPLIVQTS